MTEVRPAGTQRRSTAHLRQVLVDSPGSLGARSRSRRWQLLRDMFPGIEAMSVIDLGGTVESWRRAPVRPARVTVVNLLEPGESDESWLVPVLGDACDARKVLEASGASTEFDLTFSNSLIEHVGGHAKRQDLAREVAALSPYHWVQTPYRYFPLEPHWLFPLMQFLPVRARVTIAEKWPLAHTRPHTRSEAEAEVLWTELVSITEMRAYFPDSSILQEKVAGLTKSITAVSAPAGTIRPR